LISFGQWDVYAMKLEPVEESGTVKRRCKGDCHMVSKFGEGWVFHPTPTL
jgi:hypothetical protein